MALSTIGAHMGKYEKIVLPDKEVREALSALVERFVGVEVALTNIRIKRDVAHFIVSSVVKNQILLHEKEILSKLQLLTDTTLQKLL